MYKGSGPQAFGHQAPISWKVIFPDTEEGDGFEMIQGHYVSCALYLYYYYISSTLDHQALDPRGSGPLLYVVKENWPSADNDWCPVLCLYCFELLF